MPERFGEPRVVGDPEHAFEEDTVAAEGAWGALAAARPRRRAKGRSTVGPLDLLTCAVADQPREVFCGSVFSVASMTTRSGASAARSAPSRPRSWKPPQPTPRTSTPARDRTAATAASRPARRDARRPLRSPRVRREEVRADERPGAPALPARDEPSAAEREQPTTKAIRGPTHPGIELPHRSPRANAAAADGSIHAPTALLRP